MKKINIFESLLDLIFPPKCLLCSKYTSGSRSELCDECLKNWNKLISVNCPNCSLPAQRCRCKTGTVQVEFAAVLFFYNSNDNHLNDGKKLIYMLKRGSDRRIAKFFGREIALKLMKYIHDHNLNNEKIYITNPPRSLKAKKEYGFDQSEDLARYAAEYTGSEYISCFYNSGGQYQKNLDSVSRHNNAENSIFLKNNKIHQNRRYIIIDDVITTGCTINRCANLLYESGAKSVLTACAALTTRDNSKNTHLSNNSSELWFK